jgi:hypothetical protein
MQPNKARADLWMDVALVAFLIGLDVVARLLPHAPGFMPIAASALFAARVLRTPGLSALVLGPDDWRISLIVTLAISLPAFAGMVTRRWPGIGSTIAVMVSCSLAFFALSNLAVWAFSGMYGHDLAGLTQCYVAALPFLQNTVAGDLFWTGVLFGGAWAIQNGAMLAGRAR